MVDDLRKMSAEFSAHAPDANGLTVCSPPVNELAGAVGYGAAPTLTLSFQIFGGVTTK